MINTRSNQKQVEFLSPVFDYFCKYTEAADQQACRSAVLSEKI